MRKQLSSRYTMKNASIPSPEAETKELDILPQVTCGVQPSLWIECVAVDDLTRVASDLPVTKWSIYVVCCMEGITLPWAADNACTFGNHVVSLI